jgi:hypothetical protein
MLMLGIFGAVVLPYEQTSKQLYGHYFFNVNSAYYMWCDSWSEAVAFTAAHRNNPDFPPDQIPSPAKYGREHSAVQIAGRLLHGLKTFATRSAKPVGYYKFVLFLVMIATVFSIRQWPLARELIAKNFFAATFCFLFFLCYLVLYGWYDAVITDSRFIVSLFLPFLLVASKFVLGFGEHRSLTIIGRRLSFSAFLAASLVCLASIDIAYNALRIAGMSR